MAKLFATKALMKEPVLVDDKKPSLFKKAVKKPEVKPAGSSMLKRLTGK
jgi:hypothetical protein